MVLSFFCFSQQEKIDSLTIELQKHPEDNMDKLLILNKLSNHFHLTNPETGLTISEEAIALAQKLKSKDQEATAYKYKAYNLTVLSKDSLAIAAYNKAINIQNKLKNWNEIGRLTYNKGLLYFGQSKYQEANTCNDKAYEIFEKEKDSFLMAVVLNSIGINQMYLTQYPEALDTYLKASSIYEKTNKINTGRHAEILTNIGILYSKLGNYNLALDYYTKSLKINQTLNDDYGTANALSSIGNIYDDIEQSEKAITYYEQSLKIMTRLNNKYGIASALANTGIAHISLKNYDKALSYLNKSKPLFEELENTTNQAVVYESIGIAHLENYELGTNQKEKLSKAKLNFKKALNYAEKSNSLERKASVLENLAMVNSKLNDYKSAYYNKNEAEKLKDSFISSEKKEEIAKLVAKYEYEKKEATLTAIHDKEQAIKEAEISRHKFIKNTSIIGGGSFAIVSIIGFILYRRKQDAKEKAREAEFILKVTDTELKALRAQMNPHFIFNSLNSINEYISKNDIESATNYLTKFSKLMRETLEKSTHNEILLEDDIQILKTYMDIENKRANNSFTYTINLDESIDPENTLVPPMILQPFIENSIVHGLKNSKRNGHIIISYKQNDNMIICSVEDNGIGRKKSSELKTTSNKKSLGMTITKSRIEILNKKRNTNGSVNIIDKTDGTKIEVKLPLTLAF